ncbi:heparan-alpha-glucosaminide N-acetyltransferase [Danio aesculapii]|uniref:heparan-alpha-glucosaminide N-acetyltransferase n=1 Tax=Danio aesculapii TaxID=1142201 RepID=UPI0024BFE0C1|nr:heparan-alpha-glucosaminide N-acetyltransferase [Danio aesculapii]
MKSVNILNVLLLAGSLLPAGLCETHHEVYKLKMDEALIKFHNELPYNISVYYTSDYCYKCLYQPLATLGIGQSNISVIVSTQFTLTLQITSVVGTANLCSLSHTFEEAGHYSLWMRKQGLLKDVTCSVTVDRSPNNAYLPSRNWEYDTSPLPVLHLPLSSQSVSWRTASGSRYDPFHHAL